MDEATTEQRYEHARAKTLRLSERERQERAAAIDARERANEARADLGEAEQEYAEELKQTSHVLYGGARVPPHPDKLVHRDRCRAEAERLEAEANAAEERHARLAGLVEACKRELRARGIEVDRPRARRSNARGVPHEEPGKLRQWGFGS